MTGLKPGIFIHPLVPRGLLAEFVTKQGGSNQAHKERLKVTLK